MADQRVNQVNFERALMRLVARIRSLDPKDPEMLKVLFRAGTLVQNEAQMNLTRQGIVDSGRLRASLGLRLETGDDVARVVVGAFGIKYARMVEFGGAFTDQMRKAMFASFRERGKTKQPGKGIISGGRYKGRPYLGPAQRTHQDTIRQLIRQVQLKQLGLKS